ncbi:MAG: BMP family ABC transporter substrate-binding protein [Rickettsiales bacterium]|nr:BMP family ABC transporter substrate-binding protein [Rickettsiales bacterium]
MKLSLAEIEITPNVALRGTVMKAKSLAAPHYFSRAFALIAWGFLVLIAASSAMAEGGVNQDHFQPVMVYVTGEQESERAFIDMARKGAKKARQELSIRVNEYRIPEDKDTSEFLQDLADKGYSPIIAVGYQNVVPVMNLAEKYPSTIFTVIDGLVPPVFQNVQSITFKDHEGSFLVGMIAAYASESRKIGFIGGMDVPLIRNFGYGFEQGAKFVRPNIVVYQNMVGNTPAAWGQPEKAKELALMQYEKGADVIFAAAGGSSIGVLEAANEAKKLAVGVDTNQNGLFPGHVLTSMIKRVDVAVYNTLKSAQNKRWNAGIKSLGLKEMALDFSVDDNNKNLVTNDIIQQVLITRERIINGLIDVQTYTPQ